VAIFYPTKEYAFIDTDGLIHAIDGDQLLDAGPWSAALFYDRYNVINYQTALYVALKQVSVYPPTAIVDANWSSLVDVSGQIGALTLDIVYALALSASRLAETAVETAWTGTATANTALQTAWVGTSLGTLALQTAWTGTSLANTALQTAWVGTSLGTLALQTAWTGTATANTALQTAWVGTSLGTLALQTAWTGTSLANTALETAWVGTSLGYEGLQMAWTGTTTGDVALSVASAGTSMAYEALQQAWYGTLPKGLLSPITPTVDPGVKAGESAFTLVFDGTFKGFYAWNGTGWLYLF
jgi:hypothetical protein